MFPCEAKLVKAIRLNAQDLKDSLKQADVDMETMIDDVELAIACLRRAIDEYRKETQH